MDLRSAAGVVITCLERGEERFGVARFAFDHRPACGAVAGIEHEVGVVGSTGGETLALCQQHVEDGGAAGAVVVIAGAGIVDLDSVYRSERHHVTIRHGVPMRMS